MAALSVGAKFVYEARSFFKLTIVARLPGSEETEWFWLVDADHAA